MDLIRAQVAFYFTSLTFLELFIFISTFLYHWILLSSSSSSSLAVNKLYSLSHRRLLCKTHNTEKLRLRRFLS